MPSRPIPSKRRQGFWSVYMRNAPHNLFTFVLWEQLIALEERWNAR